MSDFYKQKEFELKCSLLRKIISKKNKKMIKDKNEFDSTFLLLLGKFAEYRHRCDNKINNYEKEKSNDKLLIKFLSLVLSLLIIIIIYLIYIIDYYFFKIN